MTPIHGQSYWDGGLVSNTPLSLAINYLEALEGGEPQVGRELIVVELFPMQAQLPQSLEEVLKRAAQLAFTSKLNLDQQLFAKLNDFVDLVQRIEQVLQALPTPEARHGAIGPLPPGSPGVVTGHRGMGAGLIDKDEAYSI